MKSLNIIFIAVFSLAIITSCGKAKTEEEQEVAEDSTAMNIVELSQEQINTIGIKTGDIQSRQMSGTIQATGRLKLSPQNRAEVTSLVNGITKRILVKEGDMVRVGQTVALVENTEIVAMQKDYLVASRQLELARAAYQRQVNINSQGAGVEKNLQQTKAELEIALATEKGIRQQLKQLGISTQLVANGKFENTAPVKSPISGVVGEVIISTGSYLDSNTILMNVYDNAAIHADLDVFESDIANIKVGQSVDLQLADQGGTPFTGKVSFVTATLDKASKSASVHVDLNRKADTKLLPNMFVSGSIHLEKAQCQAVPDEAIVMNAGRKYVFVVLGNNQFQKTEVVTGISQQGFTQITFVNKQKTTPQVVTSKAFYLESMIADHGEED